LIESLESSRLGLPYLGACHKDFGWAPFLIDDSVDGPILHKYVDDTTISEPLPSTLHTSDVQSHIDSLLLWTVVLYWEQTLAHKLTNSQIRIQIY